MTTEETLVCAKAFDLEYFDLMGLGGLERAVGGGARVFSTAEEARSCWAGLGEHIVAWVVSCDDMDAVNLAAALKHDAPYGRVLLVEDVPTEVCRRAVAASGIDGIVHAADFNEAFGCGRIATSQSDEVGQRGCLPGEYAPRGWADMAAYAAPAVQDEDGPWRGVEHFAEVTADGAKDVSSTESSPVETAASARAGDSAGSLSGIEGTCGAAARADAQGSGQGAAQSVRVASESQRGIVIPVVSGSGGSGKSTVALISAMIAARRGLRTVLLDGDLQFGDTHIALGVGDVLTLDDFIDKGLDVTCISRQDRTPALVGSLRNPERAEDAITRLPEVLDALQAEFDVVIVNTGGFWTEEHAVLLERCTAAFFMVDQRPSSLRACRYALELCDHCGIATTPIVFVINRCAKGALYTSFDVTCALRGMPSMEVRDGGSEVEELLAIGQAAELFDLRGGFVPSIEKLLLSVVPAREGEDASLDETPAKRRGRGLFSRQTREGED